MHIVQYRVKRHIAHYAMTVIWRAAMRQNHQAKRYGRSEVGCWIVNIKKPRTTRSWGQSMVMRRDPVSQYLA